MYKTQKFLLPKESNPTLGTTLSSEGVYDKKWATFQRYTDYTKLKILSEMKRLFSSSWGKEKGKTEGLELSMADRRLLKCVSDTYPHLIQWEDQGA